MNGYVQDFGGNESDKIIIDYARVFTPYQFNGVSSVCGTFLTVGIPGIILLHVFSFRGGCISLTLSGDNKESVLRVLLTYCSLSRGERSCHLVSYLSS